MHVLISIMDNFLQKQTKDIAKLEKATQCNNIIYTVTLSWFILFLCQCKIPITNVASSK